MKARTLMAFVLVWVAVPSTADAESLTYMQVLERVIQTYPTLQAATLQLERARQENARVQSQLGWTLNAQAGAGRDLSIIGTPVDRADGGASINRKLSSGSTLQFGANYLREDSTQTFSPLIPNPSTRDGSPVCNRYWRSLP